MNAFNLNDFTIVKNTHGRNGQRCPEGSVIGIGTVEPPEVKTKKGKVSRQVIVSFLDELLKRMRWLPSDKVNVAISKDETRIAIIRTPKGAYTLSPRGKGSRVADVRFTNKTLSVPKVKAWFAMDALSIEGDAVIFDITFKPLV